MGMRHVCGRCSRTFGQTGVVQAAITSPAVSRRLSQSLQLPAAPWGFYGCWGGGVYGAASGEHARAAERQGVGDGSAPSAVIPCDGIQAETASARPEARLAEH
ncbi:hypothetical protein CLOM_g22353 [Closterium sp. NIES-68]|nr:hypothetical protein CLOM_g22353 [Closterium sp. NIES-68]